MKKSAPGTVFQDVVTLCYLAGRVFIGRVKGRYVMTSQPGRPAARPRLAWGMIRIWSLTDLLQKVWTPPPHVLQGMLARKSIKIWKSPSYKTFCWLHPPPSGSFAFAGESVRGGPGRPGRAGRPAGRFLFLALSYIKTITNNIKIKE